MEELELKCCSVCKELVPKDQIGKKSAKCRKCLALKTKLYRSKNKTKVKEYLKQWRLENKEYIRKSYREWYQNKIETDLLFKIKDRIRGLIKTSVRSKNFTKKSKTARILGCDFEFFKQYIESQFTQEMNWDNIHLDHIKPMATAKTEEEVLQLNHYTNFQPLLIKDNLLKRDSLIEKQLRLL